MFSMLRALEEDVRCRLRSAVAVTSVAQCVEELVLNSVDAGASCIAVRVDLETFKVQVVDNGCGLCREDMERVGRRYFTSKCHSVEDLEELRFYGFRGEAIASMVDTSSVVEIYSKHRDSQQTFSRLFQNGKPLEVLEVESTRPSAGTTVTIYNLFFSLPVRRRCLDPAMELERIRHRVEAVSLLRPCVSFSLKNDAVHSMLLQLPKTKDLYSRFCQIYGLSRSRGLREAQHTHGTFTMQGLISREGHYNRTMQFLYVNQRLVLKTSLHKLMDSIIRKESSICRASSRPRSATDLYGIFIVNIQCPASGYDICFQPDKTLIQFQDWDAVMSCTERGLKIFLKRENLLLEPSKEAMAASGQNHRSNSSCGEGEWSSPPNDPWKSHQSDSAHLRSKCVNRSSDVTEVGAQEDHQLPSKVSQTLMVTHEGRKVCDGHEVVVNHDRSPLPSLHTCTIHKTVFTTALSCAMSETTSSVPQPPPKPSCTSTGSASTALSRVTSEKTNSFVPQHPTNRRCSSTGSASTALSCATSVKTTSFVPQNPPNPRCSSTESASTALSCATSENTALSVPPNPRYSSTVSTSIALSFVTNEKTTLSVPQNPPNRCPGTEYASIALSCVTGEKTTSSVPQNPPNLRCPGTGSASTTLSCVTSEKTTSSVPPNPRCSSTGSASTALSCVTSEKTTSCVPQNPHNLRCLRTGSASTALSCPTSEKTTSCVPQNFPNLRCPGTESASTALSCAPSEKTISFVPPNPRCPGSVSTALYCATSETTMSSVPPNPRCSSIGSASTALSCVTSEKTTSYVPQNPPNLRCPGTESASTALSCAPSEKTTSSVPPNPRCPGTGSVSTALYCARSETTTSSVLPNPTCSSIGSASTALSCATSEKTTSSVPPNPRCSRIGSASTALSYAPSEKNTSSVPPNSRCPGTGSVSTTLNCARSETTNSSIPPNPRCSSIGSSSTAVSCSMSEKTTSCEPQNPPNLRCPGTESASTALSCAPSEKTTSSVPPNPRCPGTGSVSTTLNDSSVPPNNRCSSIGSASTALSCVTSEKTNSSVPHTATYPRCPGTESKPLQKDISKFAVSTPISAPYPLPKERQKGRATKRAKNINQRHGSEPTNIQLSVTSSLGGTLDKFKRRYGKTCPADKDHQEQQPPKSPGKSEAINLISCVGTDIPPCAVRTTPPGPLDYVGIKQRESPHPECSPTLTTKLCRLKNKSEAWWGMGKPALSAPHGSVICGNGANPMSCEQQSAQSHGGQSADDSLDGPKSHEWLHCYQESLGKSVFINTATGLSSYSAPTMDTPAACTKDFSNMAVNVVCSGGFQYPCHPFKSQALLPFLPRPRHERDTAEQTEDGALSSLYTEWTNPVYERHPALAVDVSREHSDVLSVKIHNILCPYRFTKEMVHSMKVLQQVDSKFIACVMEAGLTTASGGQLLVLVDQHAAHERVRLEQLITDSFQGSSEFCERRLKVSVVDPALEIHVSEEEYRILRTRPGSLGRLGLSLSFPDTGSPRILVSEIPLCFLEREANETQRGRRPVLRSIVEEYLQEQVQLLQVTGAGNVAVPGTVLRVLASQACHGAVKFNHPLTVVECCQLMRSLAQCALPFQCAHGRPSILPLADLQHVAPEPEVSPSPNLRRLRQRLLRWQLTK
ncbi:DNA mismatch repair protein Mlh3 isoform X2 [Dendrobates tinctorius]|uniref:DNA mismatch repair protein Mlh3 isoform X2 n=1 Tax=Dendrobates tinctorius TaxID=92724 RepID=UPI003CC9D417